MKVAITGASGFIGRHVLAELKARAIDVTAVVRKLEDVSLELPDNKIVQIDILKDVPSNAFDLMGRPDVLIHLAWSGLPNYSSRHHFEKELPSQYIFLSELIKSGLQTLLAAGTCFEYGLQSGALSENSITAPSNPYGYAKNALRQQLEYLKIEYPFQLIWARLFYLYGDGQSENSLYSQLKRSAQRGDAIFNMSGGEQLRDYMPVSMAAEKIVNLAVSKYDTGIVNVCSGKPISVRKLVEDWIKENGWAITPNLGYYPYTDYEPMAFWGERKKLDGFLGNE